MSRAGSGEPSAEAESPDVPIGEPFTSETAQDAAHEAWQSIRRNKLEEHGLWETWRCVPPKTEREKPLDEYLPGGAEYER